MLKIAAAVAATLGFVGSALGQMTLLGDERYTDYGIGAIEVFSVAVGDGHESTLIGQPFVSSLSDSVNIGFDTDGQAAVDQDSSVTADQISADLFAQVIASLSGLNGSGATAFARSRVNVVFSLAAPTPYDFAVTSWSEGGFPFAGEATARLEWADGSGVIDDLVGVSSASGVLAAGEYRLILDVVAFVVGTDFGAPPRRRELDRDVQRAGDAERVLRGRRDHAGRGLGRSALRHPRRHHHRRRHQLLREPMGGRLPVGPCEIDLGTIPRRNAVGRLVRLSYPPRSRE